MKTIRFAIAGVFVVLLTAAWASAQEVPPVQVQPGQPLPLLGPGLFGGELISAKGLEKLALTKEQKADYDKINEDYQKKQKEFKGKLLDLKTPDPNVVRELFEGQRKLRPEALARVEKLLTDDQKKTFEEIRREFPGGIGPIIINPPFQGPMFGPMVGGPFLPADAQQKLKLSDDQRKKVDELQKELEAKILGVLTEEQRKAFDEMKKRSRFPIFIDPTLPIGPPGKLEVPPLPKVDVPPGKTLEVPPGKLESPPAKKLDTPLPKVAPPELKKVDK